MPKTVTRKVEVLVDDNGTIQGLKGSVDNLNKSLGKTKATQDKLEKGSANFAKNSTSAFAKQSQGLGGLVHVYATIAANVFALSAAFQILKSNADLQIMQKAAADLGRTTGINFAGVAKEMKAVTNGALGMREAMQAANLGISAGATKEQIIGITEAATKAANALGRSVPESVQRMIQAVIKAEPELVDEFGIILRVKDATEEYAKAHNKAASELTTFEKSQALINQLLTQAEQKYAGVSKYTNEFERLAATFVEMGQSIVSVLLGPLGNIAKFMSENIEFVALALALLVAHIAKMAIPALGNLGGAFVASNKKIIKANKERVSSLEKTNKHEKSMMEARLISNKKIAKDIVDLHKKGQLPSTKQLDRAVSSRNTKEIVTETKNMIAARKDFVSEFNKQMVSSSDRIEMQFEKAKSGQKGLIDASKTEMNKLANVLERGSLGVKGVGNTFDNATEKARSFGKETATTFRNIQISSLKTRTAILDSFGKGFTGGFTGIVTSAKDSFNTIVGESKKTSRRISTALIGGISAGVGGIASGLTKLASGILNITILGTVLVQTFISLASWAGIWNKESEKASGIISDINDTTKDLYDTTLELQTVREDMDASLKVQAENASAIFNVTKEHLDNMMKAFKNYGKTGSTTLNRLWDNIKGLVGEAPIDDLSESLKGMQEQLAILGATDIIVPIKLPDNFNIGRDKTFAQIAKDVLSDTVLDFGKHSKKIESLTSAAKEFQFTVGDIGSNEFNDFVQKLKETDESGFLEYMKNAKKALEEILKPIEETALGMKSLDAAVKALSDLNAKFSSSLISKSNSADELTHLLEIQKSINTITKAGKKSQEEINQVVSQISDVEKSLIGYKGKQAEIQDLINKRVEELYKRSIALLEIDVESVKLKTNLVTIQEQIDKGSISAIKEKYRINRQLYELEKQIAKTKVETLNEDLKAMIATANASQITAKVLEIQLALLKVVGFVSTKYSEQNQELEEQEAILKRIQDKGKLSSIAGKTKEQLLFMQAKDKEVSISERIQKSELAYNERIANYHKKETQNLKEKSQLEILISKAKGNNKAILEYEIKLEEIKAKIDLDRQKSYEIETEQHITHLKLITEENKVARQGLVDNVAFLNKAKSVLEDMTKLKGIDYDSQLISIKKVVAVTNTLYLQRLKLNKQLISDKKEEISKLGSSEKDNIESAKKIQEIRMIELENLNLQTQQMEQQLNLAERMFEAKKKGTSVEDVFNRPEESMDLIRKNFQLAALDFAQTIQHPIDRFTNSMTSALDNGVDAFSDALKEGDSAFSAAGTAFAETLGNAALDYANDTFKQLGRNLLVLASGGLVGQTKEEILAEELTKSNITRDSLLQGIIDAVNKCNTFGPTGLSKESINPGLAQGILLEDSADEFSDKTTDTLGSIEKGMLDNSKQVTDVMSTAITKQSEMSGQLFSLMSQSLTSGGGDFWTGLLTAAGSSLAGSFTGGASNAISPYTFDNPGAGSVNPGLAQGIILGEIGGIFNELKSIKGYASGAITNGPELAMIGEGQNKEAVVPLPDNRSIPVTLNDGEGNSSTTVNITISGVQGNEEGLRRSAGQIGARVSRAVNMSNRRYT